MKLLIDFSQLVVAAVAANQKDFVGDDPSNMIKHYALNSLLSLRKKFKGEFILCCDSDTYWRRDEFPAYKGHRVHAKKSSDLDWDMVYKTLSELIKELDENFPYRVMKVKNAEADDIIGSLTKYFQENELEQSGLFESPQEIVISSSDGDFQQLQKYKNVKQWHNINKKFIECPNPAHFLIEHICEGDTGDNIPNLCTSTQWAVDRAHNVKTRANRFMKSRFIEFYEKGIDACQNENERIHYKRNEILVDFDKIPSDIYNSIIKEYSSSTIKGTKNKVFNYLTTKRMKLLLSDYGSF